MLRITGLAKNGNIVSTKAVRGISGMKLEFLPVQLSSFMKE